MTNGSFLSLDVGDVRIGVATARSDVRFANPLVTLQNDETIWAQLTAIIQETNAELIVIGLPRNLNGDETAQTVKVRLFAADVAAHIALPQVFQDEAGTSLKAESTLNASGKPYEKGAIDALAAAYILEDYLLEHPVKLAKSEATYE